MKKIILLLVLVLGLYPFVKQGHIHIAEISTAAAQEYGGSEHTRGSAIEIVDVTTTPEHCGKNDGTVTVKFSGGNEGIYAVKFNGDTNIVAYPTVSMFGIFTYTIPATFRANTYSGLNGAPTIAITDNIGDSTGFWHNAVIVPSSNPTIAYTTNGSNGSITVKPSDVISPPSGNYILGSTTFTSTLSTGASYTGIVQGDSVTFSGLSNANTYRVTVVDNNGCSQYTNNNVVMGGGIHHVTLGAGDQISISDVSETDATCGQSNGTITLTINGGDSAGYTIELYNPSGVLVATYGNFDILYDTPITIPRSGEDPINADSYTITAKDQSGSPTTPSSTTVNDNSNFSFDVAFYKPAIANGSNGQVEINGLNVDASSCSFLVDSSRWNHVSGNILTNLPQGLHYFTVNYGTCSATDTFTVPSITCPTITLDTLQRIQPATYGEYNGSIVVVARGGYSPYTFSMPDDLSASSQSLDDTTYMFTGLGIDSYTIIAHDFYGCLSDTLTVTVPGSCGLFDVSGAVTDSVFYGSNNGSASFSASGGASPYTFRLYNDNTGFMGSLIDTGINANAYTFDSLGTGSYFVQIIDSNGCYYYKDWAFFTTCFFDIANKCAPIDNSITKYVISDTVGNILADISGNNSPYTMYIYNSSNNLLDSGTLVGTYGQLFSGNLSMNMSYTVLIKDKYNCSVRDTISFGHCTPSYTISLGNGIDSAVKVLDLGKRFLEADKYMDSLYPTDFDATTFLTVVRDLNQVDSFLAYYQSHNPGHFQYKNGDTIYLYETNQVHLTLGSSNNCVINNDNIEWLTDNSSTFIDLGGDSISYTASVPGLHTVIATDGQDSMKVYVEVAFVGGWQPPKYFITVDNDTTQYTNGDTIYQCAILSAKTFTFHSSDSSSWMPGSFTWSSQDSTYNDIPANLNTPINLTVNLKSPTIDTLTGSFSLFGLPTSITVFVVTQPCDCKGVPYGSAYVQTCGNVTTCEIPSGGDISLFGASTCPIVKDTEVVYSEINDDTITGSPISNLCGTNFLIPNQKVVTFSPDQIGYINTSTIAYNGKTLNYFYDIRGHKFSNATALTIYHGKDGNVNAGNPVVVRNTGQAAEFVCFSCLDSAIAHGTVQGLKKTIAVLKKKSSITYSVYDSIPNNDSTYLYSMKVTLADATVGTSVNSVTSKYDTTPNTPYCDTLTEEDIERGGTLSRDPIFITDSLHLNYYQNLDDTMRGILLPYVSSQISSCAINYINRGLDSLHEQTSYKQAFATDQQTMEYECLGHYSLVGVLTCNQTISSVVVDSTTPTPLEAAEMSKYAYGYADTIVRLDGGWTKVPNTSPSIITNDTSTGFKAQLFYRVLGVSDTIYTMAFAGTDTTSWLDWRTNLFSQPIGIATQYTEAVSDANAFKNVYGSNKIITYVGHSLGGGEAALAALVSKNKAITFNAACLSNLTLTNNHLGLRPNTSKIDAYFFWYDPLTLIQSNIGFSPEGILAGIHIEQGNLHVVGGSPSNIVLPDHSIQTIMIGLDY